MVDDTVQEEGVAERRESFRVDDVLSILSRKISEGIPCARSRILSGFSYEPEISEEMEEQQDEGINPKLWAMLTRINDKLSRILTKLGLEAQGLTKAEPRQVSLSRSGIRFLTTEKPSTKDYMEVKILLPLNPPVWIVVYGKVVWADQRKDGLSGVGMQFDDLPDEVSDAINRYALKRQRELIRKRKESGET